MTCPLAAFKVATFGSKSGWTYLTKDDGGVWSGDVATGETGDEIQLRAVFEEESTEYSTLLSYFVSLFSYTTETVPCRYYYYYCYSCCYCHCCCCYCYCCCCHYYYYAFIQPPLPEKEY